MGISLIREAGPGFWMQSHYQLHCRAKANGRWIGDYLPAVGAQSPAVKAQGEGTGDKSKKSRSLRPSELTPYKPLLQGGN